MIHRRLRCALPILGSTLLAALLSQETQAMQSEPDENLTFAVFEIDELEAARAEQGGPWMEFLRVPDLFAGVYTLPAGGTDGQSPHAADEVYYVVSGAATVEVDGDRRPVRAGSVIFVKKEADHRFLDITEELTLLVFFATPGGG